MSERRLSIDGRPARRMVEEIPGAGVTHSLIVLGDHGAYYSLVAAPRFKTATKKAQDLSGLFQAPYQHEKGVVPAHIRV